jgi:hypothetical protein
MEVTSDIKMNTSVSVQYDELLKGAFQLSTSHSIKQEDLVDAELEKEAERNSQIPF